jgi:hypothetical protein
VILGVLAALLGQPNGDKTAIPERAEIGFQRAAFLIGLFGFGWLKMIPFPFNYAARSRVGGPSLTLITSST